MESLRVGGLASGLDTNAIVEGLVQQAKIPMEKLSGSLEKKALEKLLYSSFNADLNTIKTDLINLRLESTFKTKSLVSSNTDILTATASTEAAVGSHAINVLQTATKSVWQSNFTHQRIVDTGAGVTRSVGVPAAYNQMEGLYSINVVDEGGTFRADVSFEGNESEPTYKVTRGTAMNTAGVDFLDANGDFIASGTERIQFTVDGANLEAMDVTYEPGYSISDMMGLINSDLNNQLNSHFGTTAMQYVEVVAQYDDASGDWNTAIYNVSDETFTVGVNDATGTLDDQLGLTGLGGFSTANNDFTKSFRADSLADLKAKLTSASSGIIKGVTLEVDGTTGLTEGSFSIYTDSSLSVGKGTPSKLVGGNTGITDIATKGIDDIFGVEGDTLTGTFTINGIEMSLRETRDEEGNLITADYDKMSIQDVLGVINSSGAGVTATWNASTKSVELRSNDDGDVDITVGDSSDTSDILELLKLTPAYSTETKGTTDGTVRNDLSLQTAGFSATVSSGTFSINGISIYVDVTRDSLDDVITKVNKSGAGVTMVFDRVNDRVTVMSEDKNRVSYGSDTDTSNLLEAIGLSYYGATEAIDFGTEGQDAELIVDGVKYVRKDNVIDDVIGGVVLNITSAGSSNINIEVDTAKAVDAMASFIQHYNQMIEKLNPESVSKEDKQYLTPLTSTEKESMSDSEVQDYQEKFEKFSRYDMILRSSELRLLKQDFRGNVLGNVTGSTGSFQSLVDLGISIAGDSIDVQKQGYLLTQSTDLDEIKKQLESNSTFTNAVRLNSDDLHTFFALNDEDSKGWTRQYQSVLDKFMDPVDGLIGLKTKTNGSIDKQMLRINEQLEAQQLRLEQYLERTWAQFTAMEKAVSQMQNQGSYLSQIQSAG